MNNNPYPKHAQTEVIDSNHGIEHILEGKEHAYYPWFRNAEHKPIYYLANNGDPCSRVRRTSYGEAYNFLAFQRGLPELPYPIVQGMELEEDYYRHG